MKEIIKNWILPPKLLQILISLQSKLIKKITSSDFDDSFRGCEQGKRCFILGTGSSTKKQDLKLLNKEIVIGVSGLFYHDDIKIINPKYYINPPIFKSHGKYYEEEKFILYLKDMDRHLSDETIMFFDISDKKYILKYNLFQKKKIIWKNYEYWDESYIKQINISSMPSIWSVSESAIQIALYLGFDEIYLLGFDHDWFNGMFNYAYSTNKARKHFETSEQDIKKKNHIDSEFQMRRHAKIFNKYKKLYAMHKNIYNANGNENTYVDTFPKVHYEDLFK